MQRADSGHATASYLEQLARFAAVGVSNTVLSYVVYATLVAARVPYLVAGAAGFAAGAVNGYRLNLRWTFRATDSTRPRVRYLAVQLASLGATTALLWLTVSVGGVHRLGGYLLTIPLVTLASFAANRRWTFGESATDGLSGGSQVLRSGFRSRGGLLERNPREERPMLDELQTAIGEWRVLVIANETVTSAALREAIVLRAASVSAQVLVVAPALNGRLRHWVSDQDTARRAADERVRACLANLVRDGIDANGHVGDADPLLAIADALRLFPADEIVIVTHPEGRSNWLARHFVARARARFGQPILHVVANGNEWPDIASVSSLDAATIATAA